MTWLYAASHVLAALVSSLACRIPWCTSMKSATIWDWITRVPVMLSAGQQVEMLTVINPVRTSRACIEAKHIR